MLSASLPGLDVLSGDAATSQTGSFPSQKLAVPRSCPVGLSSLRHACAGSVCVPITLPQPPVTWMPVCQNLVSNEWAWRMCPL